MQTKFIEDSYEQAIIALFKDELGYDYKCGYDIERDPREPYLKEEVRASVRRLNPLLPDTTIDDVTKQVCDISQGTLLQNNEAFIEEIQEMKEKNLAVELLKKLMKERVKKHARTNVVQSQKFSDMMNMSLSNYLKGLLTNEEVIKELLEIARNMKEDEQKGNDLGLSKEEKAFYDALSTPEGVRQAYSDEEFVALTRELTETLHRNKTIDWNHKESARAKMRVLIKRLLKKYKYPPEGAEAALETVMRQCDNWADNEDNYIPEKSVSPVHHAPMTYTIPEYDGYSMVAEDIESYC